MLVAFKDTLVAGQGARLVGLDPVTGQLRWEATVAQPRGTNEVERLADLGRTRAARWRPDLRTRLPVRRGLRERRAGQLAVEPQRGWHPGRGRRCPARRGRRCLGPCLGLEAEQRRPAWSADRFVRRRLAEPVVIGKHVLVADYEGQVHVLDRETGKTVQRVATDGSPAVAAARVGTTALVATRNGGVFAFQAAQ